MSISKVLVPFVTLGVSTAIGGNYIWGNQQNNLQLSKAEDKKNIKWRLLFSSKYKKEGNVLHFFYSGSLSTNEEYKSQEKDYITKKEAAKKGNSSYIGKIDFDIFKDIEKEKAKAYLDEENNKLESEIGSSTSPTDAFRLLKQYTKSNETKFKKIFDDDVYNNLLAWNWNWKQK